jgi:serine/threonine protein phosphatase PrpC
MTRIRLSVAARTDVGRVRQGNEDAFLVADLAREERHADPREGQFELGMRGALVAVSDGMGGHKAGEVASVMTLESLRKNLVERLSLVDPDERIEAAVEQANLDVHLAGRRPSLAEMGATLTAVLFDGCNAHIAQVGDSRAYLLRGGTLRQVTQDQTYVQWLIDSGTLRPSQAHVSPLRNVLLQAIGPGTAVAAALGTLSLRQRDLLILCSDGLTAHLPDEIIREVILSAPTLGVACERLVALANDRGGSDNVTVVLVGASGDLPPVTAGERISETYAVLASFDPFARNSGGDRSDATART